MTSSPVIETVQPVVNVTVPPAITAERNAAWSHDDCDVSTRAGATPNVGKPAASRMTAAGNPRRRFTLCVVTVPLAKHPATTDDRSTRASAPTGRRCAPGMTDRVCPRHEGEAVTRQTSKRLPQKLRARHWRSTPQRGAKPRDIHPAGTYVPPMNPTRWLRASPHQKPAGWVLLTCAGLIASAGCGGSATKTGNTKPPATTSSASTTADVTAGSGAGAGLAGVDSCTLLTPADFTAATAAVLASQYPSSTYTLRKVPTKTDVGPAVDQHSACTYHFTGNPGTTGEITLDVMTAAEYKTLRTYDTSKPISNLADEAAVFGTRPAFLKGSHAALIANSSGSIAFATALLRSLAPHL